MDLDVVEEAARILTKKQDSRIGQLAVPQEFEVQQDRLRCTGTFQGQTTLRFSGFDEILDGGVRLRWIIIEAWEAGIDSDVETDFYGIGLVYR